MFMHGPHMSPQGSAWLLHGSYMVSHGTHLVPHGFHMVATWVLHGFAWYTLGSTWLLHACYMVSHGSTRSHMATMVPARSLHSHTMSCLNQLWNH